MGGGSPEGLAAAIVWWRKTATGRRGCPPDQATEDRSRPPVGRCSLPLSDKERFGWSCRPLGGLGEGRGGPVPGRLLKRGELASSPLGR